MRHVLLLRGQPVWTSMCRHRVFPTHRVRVSTHSGIEDRRLCLIPASFTCSERQPVYLLGLTWQTADGRGVGAAGVAASSTEWWRHPETGSSLCDPPAGRAVKNLKDPTESKRHNDKLLAIVWGSIHLSCLSSQCLKNSFPTTYFILINISCIGISCDRRKQSST